MKVSTIAIKIHYCVVCEETQKRINRSIDTRIDKYLGIFTLFEVVTKNLIISCDSQMVMHWEMNNWTNDNDSESNNSI